jgi:hypothetical protein
MRSSLIIFILLAASACMSGCGIVPVPKDTVQVLTPPDDLLQDCKHAARPADSTVNGLMLGIVNERNVVESCDWSDKAALRAWKAGATASAIQK